MCDACVSGVHVYVWGACVCVWGACVCVGCMCVARVRRSIPERVYS